MYKNGVCYWSVGFYEEMCLYVMVVGKFVIKNVKGGIKLFYRSNWIVIYIDLCWWLGYYYVFVIGGWCGNI